jgi:hypothetical protein
MVKAEVVVVDSHHYGKLVWPPHLLPASIGPPNHQLAVYLALISLEK